MLTKRMFFVLLMWVLNWNIMEMLMKTSHFWLVPKQYGQVYKVWHPWLTDYIATPSQQCASSGSVVGCLELQRWLHGSSRLDINLTWSRTGPCIDGDWGSRATPLLCAVYWVDLFPPLLWNYRGKEECFQCTEPHLHYSKSSTLLYFTPSKQREN